MEEQLKRPATMMMKKITVPEKKSLHVHAAASGKTCFTNLPEAPAVMVTTPTKAAAALAQSKRMLGSPRTAASCLCSPTTHAGSFRCRLHRGGGGLPGSVGCGLSEIGKKSGV